jgi:hypothetical protein
MPIAMEKKDNLDIGLVVLYYQLCPVMMNNVM